jgi:glucokinase
MLVAVDTGGTKTLVTSFTKDGQIGLKLKFPTPPDEATYVRELSQILHTNFADEKVEAVVIGMPGIVKNGVAIWCNNLKWKNFNVASAFKGILGDAPIIVENDANLAGLAEAKQLKEMPAFVLYVTISTGIGSGIITEGHIDPELRYSEAGRSLVEYDGMVREWEQFASGKAILQAYGKYAREITSKRSWHQIADRISRGFLTLIPVLQPQTIIIGGSIGTFFDQYSAQLKAILKEKMPEHIPVPQIKKAKHPELAVIYGCYYYALDTLAAR